MNKLPDAIRTNETVWRNRNTVQSERPLRDALHRLEVGLIEVDLLKEHCSKDKTVRLNIDGLHYSNKPIADEIVRFSDDYDLPIQDTLNILFTEIVVNKHIYFVEIE
ncbi:TPA: hypothetical protein NU929_003371 [Vibrio cholerae]|nr:hypothetical protein [Vibrio cholerae]